MKIPQLTSLRWWVTPVVMVGVLGLVAAQESPVPEALPVPVQEPVKELVQLTVEPSMLRVNLAAGAETTIEVRLHVAEPTTFVSADAGCLCVRPELPLPTALAAGWSTLRVRVAGVLPGVKTLTIRTAAGSATATIQVVTPGFGEGAAVAAETVRIAQAAGWKIVVVVHDLLGAAKNCGCSTGSLGGIDHLAALAEVFPGARLVLTGVVEAADNQDSHLGQALAKHGWEINPPDVVITDQPLTALAQPGVLAVIDTGHAAIANQRLVRPLLGHGALAHLLLVTPAGMIAEQRILPIDQTLPANAAILRDVVSTNRIVIDSAVHPSEACASCHAAAHTAWASTAHARAFATLAPKDQVDACVTCHSSPQAGTAVRAADVGCTACHAGAAAHAAAPATPTTGVTNCRSCHDAQHHPAFDREAAWLSISHGR